MPRHRKRRNVFVNDTAFSVIILFTTKGEGIRAVIFSESETLKA